MFCQYSIDTNNNLKINIEDYLKKVIRLFGVNKILPSIVEIEKKSQEIEDFVKKCNYKVRISSILKRLITPPFITFYQRLYFQAATSI